MAGRFPFPKFRAFTADGTSPLDGGKLEVFLAGTSTPATSYTDRTEGTANANPVILDANGEADVWLPDGLFKLVLKDSSDVVQWTVDSISGGDLDLWVQSGSNIYYTAGKVFIGDTTGSETLSVTGNFSVTDTSSFGNSITLAAGANIIGSSTSDIIFDTSELKWDSATSRLGLLTATPLATLDVRGNVQTGEQSGPGGNVGKMALGGFNVRGTASGSSGQLVLRSNTDASGSDRRWSIANNQSAVGSLDFIVSADASTDPVLTTTPVLTLGLNGDLTMTGDTTHAGDLTMGDQSGAGSDKGQISLGGFNVRGGASGSSGKLLFFSNDNAAAADRRWTLANNQSSEGTLDFFVSADATTDPVITGTPKVSIDTAGIITSQAGVSTGIQSGDGDGQGTVVLGGINVRGTAAGNSGVLRFFTTATASPLDRRWSLANNQTATGTLDFFVSGDATSNPSLTGTAKVSISEAGIITSQAGVSTGIQSGDGDNQGTIVLGGINVRGTAAGNSGVLRLFTTATASPLDRRWSLANNQTATGTLDLFVSADATSNPSLTGTAKFSLKDTGELTLQGGLNTGIQSGDGDNEGTVVLGGINVRGTASGNSGVLRFFTTAVAAVADRRWTIANNQSSEGQLDFIVSGDATTNPTLTDTPMLSIDSSGNQVIQGGLTIVGNNFTGAQTGAGSDLGAISLGGFNVRGTANGSSGQLILIATNDATPTDRRWSIANNQTAIGTLDMFVSVDATTNPDITGTAKFSMATTGEVTLQGGLSTGIQSGDGDNEGTVILGGINVRGTASGNSGVLRFFTTATASPTDRRWSIANNQTSEGTLDIFVSADATSNPSLTGTAPFSMVSTGEVTLQGGLITGIHTGSGDNEGTVELGGINVRGTAAGNSGVLRFFTTADASPNDRRWSIANNQSAVGQLDFFVSADATSNPSLGGTPQLSIADGGAAEFQGVVTATNFNSGNETFGYDEATFTMTFTGLTGVPTGTAKYIKIGNHVTLTIPSVNAVGLGSTLVLGGLPAAIQPTGNRSVITGVFEDNGAQVQTVRLAFGASADITAYIWDGTTYDSTGWVATGSRGTITPMVVSYELV